MAEPPVGRQPGKLRASGGMQGWLIHLLLPVAAGGILGGWVLERHDHGTGALLVGSLLAAGFWLIGTLVRAGDRSGPARWAARAAALVGALAVGSALAPLLRPQLLTMLTGSPPGGSARVGSGSGFTLYTDIPDEEADAELTSFLVALRRQMAHDLGARSDAQDWLASCPDVRILVLWNDDSYLRLARSGVGIPSSPFGYYLESSPVGPLIVVRGRSGLGTLSHELAHHLQHCAFPPGALPRWLDEGLATRYEKLMGLRTADGWTISLPYRSNWRFPRVLERLDSVDFEQALPAGQDQSVFHTLVLFLEEQGYLPNLLELVRTRARASVAQQLEEATHVPLPELQASWRRWLTGQALQVPALQASLIATGEAASLIAGQLDRAFLWVPARRRWESPAPKHDPQDLHIPDFCLPDAMAGEGEGPADRGKRSLPLMCRRMGRAS